MSSVSPVAPDAFARIAASVEQAMMPREPRSGTDRSGEDRLGDPSRGEAVSDGTLSDLDDDAAAIGPSDADENGLYDGRVDPEIVAACAALDHSDTDNGTRLLRHFGQDLRVLRIADAKTPAYVAWAGTHWDPDNGVLLSHAVAQKVGGRIGLEADLMVQTPFEAQIITEANQAEVAATRLRKQKDLSDDDKIVLRQLDREIDAGDEARDALERRQVARRKFAVSSKNKARIEAMLICAAPHCAVDPDDFNADPFVLPTKGHTLRFERGAPRAGDGFREARIEATPGHRREDMTTRLVPVAYDPDASCPKWRAFLDRFMPDARKRLFLQDYSGLGLLGRTVQMILFHYGSGANGKSVFLETLMRVMGAIGVGLPAESVTGSGERSSGGASPDLARLYGVRMVRILELPADKPLHEDLVKKLTGGEKIPVRTLFKGYFEFTPVFTAHMSGNGYPKIDGTDNGIWRRMKVLEWPVQLEEHEQREFEDVLADFAPEYPGILNWLIDGALRFLENGIVVPDAVKAATDEYRSAMDPIRDFVTDCVERTESEDDAVTARAMYDAYVSWGLANAHRPFSETRFGRDMKKKFTRIDSRVRRYVAVRLHDVPDRPHGNHRRDDGDPGPEPR